MATIRSDKDDLVVYGANTWLLDLNLLIWNVVGLLALGGMLMAGSYLSQQRQRLPGVVVETPFGVFLARLTRTPAEAAKLHHRLEEARALS